MLAFARNANLALAFIVELAMLAAFALGALSLGLDPLLRWIVAIAVVAAVVTAWAVWAAPRAAGRLRGRALAAFKIGLFALATLALLAAGFAGWAITFAVAAALNLVLAWIWDQQ
jgi:Protein of unknown function (DUF2568)